MKNWWGIPYGIFIGLCVAGVLLLISRQPQGEPIELLPPPTSSPFLVYITGAVKNPGVFALPAGSRVADAVQAAGGFTSNAAVLEIDLAAKVNDGQTIRVPAYSLENNLFAPDPQADVVSSTAIIDINIANQDELEKLPGIGSDLAASIVQFRTQNGSFQNVEDIQAVPGITLEIFDLIKNQITTGSAP